MRRFLSYLSRSKTRFLGEERPRKTTAPGRGNTMAVKDGEGAKKAAKRAAYCLTLLSETRRKSPGKRPAGGQRTCC